MIEKPNDRLNQVQPDEQDPEPKIFLVVDNQKFMRPGLETYFARPPATGEVTEDRGCSCNPVMGIVCKCNKVCTCNPQCSCQGHTTCSCVGHRSSGGGSYCSCVPVH